MVSIVASIFLLNGLLPAPRHAPRWFDLEIAGYRLSFDVSHGDVAVIDPKTRYMLIRNIECDGADITLLLTKDRYEVDGMGVGIPAFSKDLTNKDMQAKEKPLPNLQTGKGISIGDDIQEVMSKLGAPSKRFMTGNRHQFANLLYSWLKGKGIEADLYEETYVFKADRLIEILFTKGPDHGYSDMAVFAPKAKDAVKKRKGD